MYKVIDVTHSEIYEEIGKEDSLVEAMENIKASWIDRCADYKAGIPMFEKKTINGSVYFAVFVNAKFQARYKIVEV